MHKLGQLVRTTWKRLLTLRMVAWSPVLVVAVVAWWGIKWLLERRRAKKAHIGSRQHPAIFLQG